MRLRSFLIAFATTIVAPAARAEVTLINAFPNLTFRKPVDVAEAPDGSNRMFVVEQRGLIDSFQNDPDADSKSVFLDLQLRVTPGFESGLLALAFDPDFATNGYFYVSYTTYLPQLTSVVSRFTVSPDDPNRADTPSEVVLLEVPQPCGSHNTHRLRFGPDGYLYIGCGDGCCCGDLPGRAQNRADLRGSILRIDVHGTTDDLPYRIPPDNPFVGNSQGFREEIFAYGFRNPWQFSFDADGRLWAADVGQDSWEEVDWVVPGGNYGWNVAEGSHCFGPLPDCNLSGLMAPVWEYPHVIDETGGLSVIGGYVYSGDACPQLQNRYIVSDFISRNVWALDFDDAGVTGSTTLLTTTDLPVSGFGISGDHELYVLGHGANGAIYRFACTTENVGACCLADQSCQQRTADECNSIDGVFAGIDASCADDCNTNGIADVCDLLDGGADCNANAVPDECEPDCNANGIEDDCELSACVDECIAGGGDAVACGLQCDANQDGSPDDCNASLLTVIPPDRDATLYEREDGSRANGAGEHLFVGRTAQPSEYRRRALVHFDVASYLPFGAVIESAVLQATVSKTVTGPDPVALHRVQQSWGEGGSDADPAAGREGQGAPPTDGDVTWIHRSFGSDTWLSPGGDYEPVPDAESVLNGLGSYVWGPDDDMTADVQSWLDQPQFNHGWELVGDETQTGAKRLDSREHPDPSSRPVLIVAYTLHPCLADADCNDADPCTLDLCTGEGCVGDATIYGDIASHDGACLPDGQVDIYDLFKILDVWEETADHGCAPSSADLSGLTPCEPDGLVNILDVVAILDAFQQLSNCCQSQ